MADFVLRKLHDAIRMIEEGRAKDACGVMRPLLERHIKRLCKSAGLHQGVEIYKMIQALRDNSLIDDVGHSKFTYLKNLGNAGVHDTDDIVTTRDAMYFFQELLDYFNLGENDFPPTPVAPKTPEGRGPLRDFYENEQKRKALITAYYLSEFEHHRLGLGNQTETFQKFAEALGVKVATLRQYRDHFDPITSSKRRGYWQIPTPPQFREIFNEFKGTEEPQLREMVLGFLEG